MLQHARLTKQDIVSFILKIPTSILVDPQSEQNLCQTCFRKLQLESASRPLTECLLAYVGKCEKKSCLLEIKPVDPDNENLDLTLYPK